MDFRGFDSSIISNLGGGIPRPIGNFPESLAQAILVGVMLVGRLGVCCSVPVFELFALTINHINDNDNEHENAIINNVIVMLVGRLGSSGRTLQNLPGGAGAAAREGRAPLGGIMIEISMSVLITLPCVIVSYIIISRITTCRFSSFIAYFDYAILITIGRPRRPRGPRRSAARSRRRRLD